MVGFIVIVSTLRGISFERQFLQNALIRIERGRRKTQRER